jgi:vacuolar-type H+-ATPase subunit H
MAEGDLEKVKALESRLSLEFEQEKKRCDEMLESAKAKRAGEIEGSERRAHEEAKKIIECAVKEAEEKNTSSLAGFEARKKELASRISGKKDEAIDCVLRELGV